jgi:small-conductance mechanosensitive channel
MGDTPSVLESWLQRDLLAVGPISLRLSTVLSLVLIIAIAVAASRLFRVWMQRIARRGAEGNQPGYYAIGRLGHYTIVVIAAMLVVDSVGVDVTALKFAAGAVGIGVGLGLQSIVNNFVSGLLLLFERTVKVGDFVELDSGLQGTVQAINVRSTVITTNDNLDVVVPNSLFTSGVLTNWTMTQAQRRIHVPFGVAYGSDKEIVRRAALEAAARVDVGDSDPARAPQVWLVQFGESSLDFELVVWVGRGAVDRPGRTRARYLWELETSLREHGIEIPFPQRDLHLKTGAGKVVAAIDP